MKKTRLLEIIQEEINTAINEIPDFGGKFDSQVSDKHGEEDTLQSATDEIVDETLEDMGVTKADLKKERLRKKQSQQLLNQNLKLKLEKKMMKKKKLKHQ